MKILIAIIICISSIVCLRTDKVDSKRDNKYIYEMIKKSRTGYSKRKYDTIIMYSKENGLNARIMANLAMCESSFNRKKVNKYTGCVGLFQVSPKWWKHLCHVVQGGKYSNRLNTHEDYIEVMKYIGVNTEMACIIMRHYLDQHGNYSDALLTYGGWRKRKYRNSEKKYDYLKKVLK